MDNESTPDHLSNGKANGHAKGHKWDFAKVEPTEKSSEAPPRQIDLAKPVPGSDTMMITANGKTAPAYALANLKRGNNEGNKSKTGYALPDLPELLAKVLSHEINGMNGLEAILTGQRNKAIKGDPRCADLLLNRAYGANLINLTDGLPPEPITGFTIEIQHEDVTPNEAETKTKPEAAAGPRHTDGTQ